MELLLDPSSRTTPLGLKANFTSPKRPGGGMPEDAGELGPNDILHVAKQGRGGGHRSFLGGGPRPNTA